MALLTLVCVWHECIAYCQTWCHIHILSPYTFMRLNCAPEYNLCDYYCQPFLWKVFDYVLWRNKHKLAAMQTLDRLTNRPTALLTERSHFAKTNKYGFTCTNLFMTNVFLYLLQRFLRSFRIPFVLSECGFQFLLKIFVVFSIFFVYAFFRFIFFFLLILFIVHVCICVSWMPPIWLYCVYKCTI